MREGLRYGQQRKDNPDGTSSVTGECKLGHHQHTIVVPTGGLDNWLEGNYVQTAMPNVPAADREFLISASCGPCFDKLFGPGEDDDHFEEETQEGPAEEPKHREDGSPKETENYLADPSIPQSER